MTISPKQVDYFVGFRPPPGFLKTLSNLKLVISLGAGVDGFLGDPEFPKHVPLVRFRIESLALEMAQYVTMHVLIDPSPCSAFSTRRRQSIRGSRRCCRAPPTRLASAFWAWATSAAPSPSACWRWDFWCRAGAGRARIFPASEALPAICELKAFLGQCDMLVCVLPLTPETRDMMNAEFFALLPRGAWVINVARGGMLVEEDLIAALDSGHLDGAVLDVFQTEPLPEDSPLWRHPKITVTPHIAGITDPRVALRYIETCVADREAGRALKDIVAVDRGY